MKLLILFALFAFANCQDETVTSTTTVSTTIPQDSTAATTAIPPLVRPGLAYETPIIPDASKEAKAQPNGNTNDEYPDRIDISSNPAFGNALGNVDKLNPEIKPEIPTTQPVDKPTETDGKKQQPPTGNVNPQLPVNPLPPQNFNPNYPLHFQPYPHVHLNQIPQPNLVPINPYGYNGINTRPVFAGYHPGYSLVPLQHFHTGYIPHPGYHQFNPYAQGPSPIFTGPLPNNFLNPAYPALQPPPQPHHPPVQPTDAKQPETPPKVNNQEAETASKITPVITDNVNPVPSITIPLNPNPQQVDINPVPVENVKPQENVKATDQVPAASTNTFSVDDTMRGIGSQVRYGYGRVLRDFRRNMYYDF